MKLNTTLYSNYEQNLPQSGAHILAQYQEETVVVYQAFNPRIAKYAIEHQQFGGEHYRFSRMSWIKPNFLWMMYRCGWATKEAQKRVLAIELSRENFEYILSKAVHSSFQKHIYQTEENWKTAMTESSVQLQWDPDHDPYGGKLARRAIQLGLRGEILQQFGTEWIVSIQDITDFVLEEGVKVKAKNLESLLVMQEQVYPISDAIIRSKIGLDSWKS